MSAVCLGLPALSCQKGSLDSLLPIATGEEGLYGFTPAQMNFSLPFCKHKPKPTGMCFISGSSFCAAFTSLLCFATKAWFEDHE